MPFVVNPAAVDELVRMSPEWREHCEMLAVKGVSYAQSIAPVETGNYRASLYHDVGPSATTESVPGAPAVHIGTNCEYGLEVEFQNPARHLVLLRTLDNMRG